MSYISIFPKNSKIDGVFKNKINFKSIHYGPTLLLDSALRQQPNQCYELERVQVPQH